MYNALLVGGFESEITTRSTVPQHAETQQSQAFPSAECTEVIDVSTVPIHWQCQ